jgi:hypothetical protein
MFFACSNLEAAMPDSSKFWASSTGPRLVRDQTSPNRLRSFARGERGEDGKIVVVPVDRVLLADMSVFIIDIIYRKFITRRKNAMRPRAAAWFVVLACLTSGPAAHAQEEVYTVWVTRNGSSPQPFFFGYGRTLDIAEKIAFRACGGDCTILKSGPGCVSITMANQEFYPRGCGDRNEPDVPTESG